MSGRDNGFGVRLLGQESLDVNASFGLTPRRIPRIIHQTHKSRELTDELQGIMGSWQKLNPEWEVRFYDNDDCAAFVQKYFPEYWQAYQALPKNVERADFFRYLVVLQHGGLYADVDCQCRQPLDTLILPEDTLIVGYENSFRDVVAAYRRTYARVHQLVQWTFIAAPGHPALRALCNDIKGALSMGRMLHGLQHRGQGALSMGQM
eukprot:gene6390-7655_t